MFRSLRLLTSKLLVSLLSTIHLPPPGKEKHTVNAEKEREREREERERERRHIMHWFNFPEKEYGFNFSERDTGSSSERGDGFESRRTTGSSRREGPVRVVQVPERGRV